MSAAACSPLFKRGLMPIKPIEKEISKLTIEDIVNKINELVTGSNELYERYCELSNQAMQGGEKEEE